LPSEENKERKFPIKRGGESKKENFQSKIGRKQKKYAELSHSKQEKARKPRPKVVLSL